MMSPEQFREAGHKLIDWIADYQENAERYPVLTQVKPGEVRQAVERKIPVDGEKWEAIWQDFETKILPGVTHWQSPNFFAYFPANTSYPAILGELLSAGLGVNGMLWSTCPAATELETLTLDWLVDMLDLPPHFKGSGVIQDTASSATLCALLCAREQATSWESNQIGVNGDNCGDGRGQLCIYTSDQAHSSVEKAVKIIGLGRESLRLIKSDPVTFGMDIAHLEHMIANDIAKGNQPCFVCATMGTTSSLAMDPIKQISDVCRKYNNDDDDDKNNKNIWLHVDGAMAGSALICPEFRFIADGLEFADSYCFNPHKWMFTNFDCDVFYVREPERLVRTLSILPEYLKADQSDAVINYRDWHIPLGRRFRALKLWFVIRSFGVEGIQNKIREHVQLAKWVENEIINGSGQDLFELVTSRNLNLVCFRLQNHSDEDNQELMRLVNATGKAFLTHTKLNGKLVIRMSIGQTRVSKEHVEKAWKLICENGRGLTGKV